MGCNASKPVIETTDDVLRNCKARRLHIEDAIKYRRAFAIAHASYIHSLRDVGSALKDFAHREYVGSEVSTRTSSTPVLALPPPLLSSIDNLSPPRDSGVGAPTLSPPHSLEREIKDLPSTLPPEISISPPLSPMRLPTSNDHLSLLPGLNNQVALPLESPSASLPCTTPPGNSIARPQRSHSLDSNSLPQNTNSLNSMVSPDRGSEFSAPYYSPSRDDLDEALVAYSPARPSSLLTDTTWFNFEKFTPPLIPHHLQEQRRMKQAGDLDWEDSQGAGKIKEVEEDIPELEELDHEEDDAICDDRVTTPSHGKDEVPFDMMSEEIEKRVVLEETVVDSAVLKGDEFEKVADDLEDTLHVPSTSKETVPLETVVPEMPSEGEVMQRKQGPVIVLKKKNVPEAMQYIDDLFARAYQCGQDVSRMLETQMHHYANTNGMKDSTKVFNAISSHWLRKTPSSVMGDDDEGDNLLECGMFGSHASTLERLYAWERKLHHEVKEGRLLRISFDQKYKELHTANAKDGNQIERDTLKATIKKLDTRLLVAVAAISAASTRIQLLTNDELYPQLCEMLGGLVSMWRMMLDCHRTQAAVALELQTLEDIKVETEATEIQKKATVKLKRELEKLQTHLQDWIWSQRKYIVELDEWIKKCYEIRDLRSSEAGKRNSSDRTEKAPIFSLLDAWRCCIMDLKPDSYVNGIKTFTAAIHVLEEDQFNELKSKKQAEKSTKRLGRQTIFLDKLEREYAESKRANLSFSPSRLLRFPSGKNIPRNRAHLDKYKTQAETQRSHYFTAAQSRKNATLDLLQQQLPTLFQSFSSFAEDAQKMYERVKEMAEREDTKQKQTGTACLIWEESTDP